MMKLKRTILRIQICAIMLICASHQVTWAGVAASSLGTAVLTPNEVKAGSKQRFELIYTVDEPILTGGGIKVYFATPFLQSKNPLDVGMQNADNKRPGYTSISTTSTSVGLRLKTSCFGGPEWGTRLGEATITVISGVIKRGDIVNLIYGAGDQKAFAQEIAHDAEVTVLVSTDGSTDYQEIQYSPVLKVFPLAPFKLISAINQDANELKISAVDMYGNFADHFSGLAGIHLASDKSGYKFIDDVFISEGKGAFQIPSYIPDGYYVIKTELYSNGLQSHVPYTPGKQNVYFGDMHFHTRLSDSYVSIDPRDSYMYGRDAALLDFLAVADHAEEVVKNEIYTQFLTRNIPDSWEEIKNINYEYNVSGQFVTFLGYETTAPDYQTFPRDGHNNVYYKEYTGEIYPHHRGGNDIEGVDYFDSLDELWDKLSFDMAEALTIPHHTLYSGGMGSDFYYYNPEYEKLIEIYSHHGCSEQPTCELALDKDRQNPKGAVQRAVGKLGQKLGFIAGSDNHFGHSSGTGLIEGKGRKSGGITAILADSLTKDSLWNAMSSRSTYATSGERIYLEFTINGATMGRELNSAGPPKISARVIGTNNIISVEVIKYDKAGGWKTIYYDAPNRLFWNNSFKDNKFTANSVYYLKVKQVGGDLVESYFAWSSPIWVNK